MSDEIITEVLELIEKQSMVIQTLIFPKDRNESAEAAKAWASKHGFKSEKVDETGSSFRLRQRPPVDFQKGSFRTFCLSPNKDAPSGECKVMAVGGRLKKEDEIEKGEYPVNRIGYGFDSTLASKPHLLTETEYTEPEQNYSNDFCGACAFHSAGKCAATDQDVDMYAKCNLHIPMRDELMTRQEAFLRREAFLHDKQPEQPTVHAEDDLEIYEKVDKYIKEENGKFCIYSHTTGKNLGCSDTREKAEERLARMKRFRKSIEVKLAATDDEKHLVYGIVLEPDETDTHRDTVTPEEIEKAAHRYAVTPMIVGDGHQKKAKARVVETFIHNPDVMKAVKPRSWVMVVKVEDDDMWMDIKEGKYTGFSIGARAHKRAYEPEEGK